MVRWDEEVNKMRIAINAGHTSSGAGYGAVYKGFRESDITREVAALLAQKLRHKGHTVHDVTVDKASTQNAYLREVCKRADETGAELTLSIHCNASATRKGYGTECWTWKGAKVPQAVKICSQMAKLGFRNRGIKDGSNLYVIRNTKAETVLIELFFLDNYTDRKLYLDKGAEAIADAIAAAI